MLIVHIFMISCSYLFKSHKMDNISYKDFPNICRICMSNCDINFNKNSIMLDIFHKLTDVHFEVNNELPQQICRKCFHFINEIHSFTMTYKQTHSILMECLSHYKNIGIKQESEIIEETTEQLKIYELDKDELVNNWEINEDMEIKDEIIEEHKIEFVNAELVNNWEIKEEMEVEHNDELNDWETNNALAKSVTDSINDLLTPISTNNDEESINDLNEDSENSTNTIPVRNNKKYKQYKLPSVSENWKTVKRSRYKCDQCEKSFTSLSQLKQHERVHTEERPYICDVCEKSYPRSDALKVHKRVHSGERPFKCDECGKSFTQSGSLQKHKRIHSGERPYKCDHCEKSFTQSSDLARHKRVHSGERPFKCDQCEKTCTSLSNLKSHKFVHSREGPFKCDQCEASFLDTRALNKHELVHSHNVN